MTSKSSDSRSEAIQESIAANYERLYRRAVRAVGDDLGRDLAHEVIAHFIDSDPDETAIQHGPISSWGDGVRAFFKYIKPERSGHPGSHTNRNKINAHLRMHDETPEQAHRALSIKTPLSTIMGIDPVTLDDTHDPAASESVDELLVRLSSIPGGESVLRDAIDLEDRRARRKLRHHLRTLVWDSECVVADLWLTPPEHQRLVSLGLCMSPLGVSASTGEAQVARLAVLLTGEYHPELQSLGLKLVLFGTS